MGSQRRLTALLAERGIESERLMLTLDGLNSLSDTTSDAVFTFTQGGSAARLIAELQGIIQALYEAQTVVAEETTDDHRAARSTLAELAQEWRDGCTCRGGPHGGYTCPRCSGGRR